MRSAVVCLALLVGLLSPALAQTGDEALLPPDGFSDGWERSQPLRVFRGADLYGHINGGSELFLEFGFERLTVQNFRKSEDEISIELYRMTDRIAAAGIYFMKCGNESPDPGLKERHSLNTFQLMFLRANYFVVINNLEGEPGVVDQVLLFADYIASRLPPAAEVKFAAGLPDEGRVLGSLRIIRGEYALNAIFTLGEGDILSLERKRTAVAADYETANSSYTLIGVDYGEQEIASRAWKHLVRNLDRYLTLVAAEPTRLVFKDHAGEYGLLRKEGTRVEVRVHLKDKP